MARRRQRPASASDYAAWIAASPFRRAPHVTTAQRDEHYPAPANHFRIFNTTNYQFEVFVDGTWTSESTGEDVSGVVLDYFYTIGGMDAGKFRTPWQYDHEGDSWSAGTDATEVMARSAGWSDDGLAYVVPSGFPRDTQRWNSDGSWTILSQAPFAAQDRCAAASEGLAEFYGETNSAFVYKGHFRNTIAGDSWAEGTLSTANQRFCGATNIDTDTNLLHGGTIDGASNWTNATDGVFAHDLGGDSFTTKTVQAQARASYGHFLLGGDVFACAGQSDNPAVTLFDRLDSYAIVGDSWTSRTAWPPGLTEVGPQCGARVSGTAYAVGGQGSGAARSYEVDTWTTIATHGGTTIRGAYNSSMALVPA